MPAPTSGLRVQVTGQATIYFTLDGQYHAIPAWHVYLRLFPGGGAVLQETSIANEFIGAPLGGDADVLKGDDSDSIYFYNNGKKRPILGWTFVARAFNGHFRTLPQAVVDAIPSEGPITDA